MLKILIAFLLLCNSPSVYAGWSFPPEDVSVSGGTQSDAQVAVSSNNYAVAVWVKSGVVQSSTKTLGGVWSTPVNVSAAGASIPQVAIDASGNAVAIWRNSVSGVQRIESASLPFGGSWTSPVLLDAGGQNSFTPQIAMNASGQTVAVWSRNNPSLVGVIQSSFYTFGGSWSAPVDLSNDSQNARIPQVGIDGSGTSIAVWLHNDGFFNMITQSSYASFGGSWSTPQDLSPALEDTDDPQIAVNTAGLAVSIWRNGTQLQMQAAKFQNGVWTSVQNITTTGLLLSSPGVAIDASGNATALWRIDSGGSIFIQSSFSTFTGSWQALKDVSLMSGNPTSPDITVDLYGDFIAIWRDNVGTNVVKASRSILGGDWETPTTLSTVNDNILPQVSSGPTGYAVAVWVRIVPQTVRSVTYTAAPIVLSVQPNVGPVTGGNTVLITGGNFTGTTSVLFGTQSASFVVLSDTQIQAIVPAASGATTVSITVTTGAGSGTGASYSYVIVNAPRKFHGTLFRKHHFSHDKYLLKARWKAPHQTTVSFYRVYEDGKDKYAFKPHTHKFKKKVRTSHHLHHRYKITSVDQNGIESEKKKLKIVKVHK